MLAPRGSTPDTHLLFLRPNGNEYDLDAELRDPAPAAEPELDAVVTLQRLLE